MKSLYTKILARLATVSAIRFSDLDKGQMETYDIRPTIAFPAALISISLPRTEDLDVMGTRQRVQALFNIRLVVDFSGDTSSITGATAKAASLAYLDLADEITAAFQGWSDAEVSRIKRESLREERRQDAYKVVNITFATSYEERF